MNEERREDEPARHTTARDASPEKTFRGWRLLGIIGIVVLVLAVVSFVVDWLVIGPLEGRVF